MSDTREKSEGVSICSIMAIASFSSSCTSLGRWDRDGVTTITDHQKLQPFEAASHMLAIRHLHLGPYLLGCPAEHLCKQQNNQRSRNNSSCRKKCVSQGCCQDPWLSFSNFAPCYSHCLLTSVPYVGHLASTAPGMKTVSVSISRRDALFVSTSFKMEKRLFWGLWLISLFFHWTNKITWLARRTQATVRFKPIMIHPLETEVWSSPLQNRF